MGCDIYAENAKYSFYICRGWMGLTDPVEDFVVSGSIKETEEQITQTTTRMAYNRMIMTCEEYEDELEYLHELYRQLTMLEFMTSLIEDGWKIKLSY